MIGKQIKGRGFRGLLNYLAEKPNASLIGGNMSGRNSKELASEFRISRQLNRDVDRAVYHVSLSLHPNERLDNDTWNEIASRYLAEMGFDDNQYAVYRHFDTDHDHIHIAASRIRLDTSKVVSDSWDYLRSEKIIRSLEKDYGLQSTISSREKKARTASTGQQRRVKRELSEYERGDRKSPPSPPVKEQLQEVILSLTRNKPSMPELIAKLHQVGVEVRCQFTRTQKVKGISYSKDGVCFSGTNLGAAFTFKGLQKHLGVKGFLEEDQLQIQMLFERIALGKPVDDDYITRIQKRRVSYSNPDSLNPFISDIQYDYADQIAPVLRSLWECQRKTITGKNYKLEVDSDAMSLILTRTKSKEKIIAYIPLDSRFEPFGIGLTPEDVQQILASLSKNTQPSMKTNKQPELPLESSNNFKSRGFER